MKDPSLAPQTDPRADDLRRLVNSLIKTYGLTMLLTALIEVLDVLDEKREQYLVNVVQGLRRTLKQYKDRYKDEEG